jgi:chemotaxis methyl-accepting protein methylase
MKARHTGGPRDHSKQALRNRVIFVRFNSIINSVVKTVQFYLACRNCQLKVLIYVYGEFREKAMKKFCHK